MMFMANSPSSSPPGYTASSRITTAANLPSFVSRDAPAPMKGIWRSAFTDWSKAGKPFIYTLSQNRGIMALFKKEFDAQYHDLCSTAWDLIFVPSTADSPWTSTTWRHTERELIFIARCNEFDLILEGRNYYCLGWLELPDPLVAASSVRVEINLHGSSPIIHTAIDGRYIYVYCANSKSECRWLVEELKGHSLTMHFGDSNPVAGEFHSPVCPIHELCPFATLWDDDESQKQSHDKLHCAGIHEETHVSWAASMMTKYKNIPKRMRPAINPFRHYNEGHDHPVLERKELVQQIIDCVIRDKVLLIEAPPCSGKSTLLDNIAFAVMRWRSYAIHILKNFKVDVTSKSHEDKVLPYSLRCSKYSVNLEHNVETFTTLKTIENVTDLLNFLNSEPLLEFEFWIFVDEAQRVYDNDKLWQALTVPHTQQLFVVAAGSYGSHTGSAAHSPSQDYILKSWRINLFPSETELCVAFKESDFDEFIGLALKNTGYNSLDVNLRERIMNYASPYPSNNTGQKLLHPGVAVELTMYLLNKLVKQVTIDAEELFVSFRNICLDQAKNKDSYGLGQCVPHLPIHNRGFTGLALVVFISVLLESIIEVLPIDTGCQKSVSGIQIAHTFGINSNTALYKSSINTTYATLDGLITMGSIAATPPILSP
ncbi:hypothetical protein BT96DRAFT_1006660 [Gymnopus androsaceus JB14]|uniref:Uncharacterized protein n=1 Tax=Gymnopus androsaceus JB14 TaxID=1447944 RepID=A0A6A4GJP1_9AGAR|nr:hypothetical protein BT96DRAFT_1006660 [Gymnopus androsaceus JB14]